MALRFFDNDTGKLYQIVTKNTFQNGAVKEVEYIIADVKTGKMNKVIQRSFVANHTLLTEHNVNVMNKTQNEFKKKCPKGD